MKDLQQRLSVLENATKTKDPRLSFIEEAIEESFSLGFNNYHSRIKANSEKYFSAKGQRSYQNILSTLKLTETLSQIQGITDIEIIGEPSPTGNFEGVSGPKHDDDRTWRSFIVPVRMDTMTGSKHNYDDISIKVTVMSQHLTHGSEY